ncbi:MAG: hydrogenase maturation protease, partial [Candidatus Rokuibacteriota bacterium]
MPRTLLAGFGNVLRGDDGFGVEVLRRLRARGALPGDVELMDVGTGGIRLAQELLARYDRLVIVDAVTRGGAPGTVYVLAVDAVEPVTEIDLHLAVPSRALAVAKALGALPPEVFIVGCEPAEVDELTTELTPAVRAAVDTVIGRIDELLGAGVPPAVSEADPVRDLARRDEILQVLFWLHGEGLGTEVTAAEILKFVDDRDAVERVLAQLVDDGCVAPVPGNPPRYRLTARGAEEGRRRFLDEFEPYLARHAHGECGTA